jgi:quercetin dioxygenase-like cupin family protein/predicted dehydrogenase
MTPNNRSIAACIAFLAVASACTLLSACQSPGGSPASDIADTMAAAPKPVRLITLDPGHFHAALVQKSMYNDIDSVVHVYAPAGPDVQSHLDKINAYNTREKSPTHWVECVYTGPDYLQKMIADKAGNTVILAGNNREKTDYILQSLQAGFHVLGDKPMVIDDQGFTLLRQAFDTAAARRRILYDIMTERYEITSILQRELAMVPVIFGTQEKGSPSHPGVVAASVHRWYKYVSGNALTRPAWFFDVSQQGEGIADVMTHLVDLVQWGCFPDQALDYTRDIQVDKGRHWTTDLTLSQFRTITKLDSFPDFLKKDLLHDTVLKVYADGEIDYRLKGVYVRTTATWTYNAPQGADDTYSSLMRGSLASLVIRQDAEQQYHPTLYIEPAGAASANAATQPANGDPSYDQTLQEQFKTLQAKYPGIGLKKEGQRWEVLIPDSYKEGHEAHFARVTQKFLEYVKNNDMPSWEVPDMIAKYYTTTKGLELARKSARPAGDVSEPVLPAITATAPPADTLKAQVCIWNKEKFRREKEGQVRQVLKGATHDLSLLDIRAITLLPGKSTGRNASTADQLIIVKTGNLTITTGNSTKKLGPGGIALFAAGENLLCNNAGATPATYYLFRFQSRSPENPDRARQAGGPILIDWPEMTMKPTDKGESRQIFNRPVEWLGKIDMHATTLNPGEVSHPPHTHRLEEIILMRSGHVQMHIGNNYYPASGGDLIFLSSGIPHALENRSKERCEYFALQWEQ